LGKPAFICTCKDEKTMGRFTLRLPLTPHHAILFPSLIQGKDDAGYSALTTRMRHAKVTCQEILGMFQAR
jgi:hypothetical protein